MKDGNGSARIPVNEMLTDVLSTASCSVMLQPFAVPRLGRCTVCGRPFLIQFSMYSAAEMYIPMGQVLQMQSVSTVKLTAIDTEHTVGIHSRLISCGSHERKKASTCGNCSFGWKSVAFYLDDV